MNICTVWKCIICIQFYHYFKTKEAAYWCGKPRQITGEYRVYYDNGNPKYKCYFKNRLQHGEFNLWDKNGMLKKKTIFENGHDIGHDMILNWIL